ncbi:MAG: serine/threonine protein kinase [Proteobacteria bacterium]|nr:serine/threonine protein kinase [Pseudomonadota bacterium]
MKLGAYTLIKQIAEGGVADIYLAKARTAAKADKYLICKCIKKSLSEDTDFLKSILNEVHCTIKLRHPNIVEVFDLLACDGHSFLTMEYLDAQDFHKLLKHNGEAGETMPLDMAIYAIGQAALGLHAAHELTDSNGRPVHLVHRDVSPENILFGSNGEIKLADFGIAKTANMADQTPQDIIKGKFNYMSPEHAWGDKLDRRSDLFSLAIIMYEAILNRSFYPTESVEETVSCARMAMFEPPHNIQPDFPADLEKILLKALDLDKKLRYPTALEFKMALDDCAAAHGWKITRESWIEYLKTRVAFPSQKLPLMHAGEMPPDPNSILKPETTERPADTSDIEITGQVSADHMAEIVNQAAAMRSSVMQPVPQVPLSSLPSETPEISHHCLTPVAQPKVNDSLVAKNNDNAIHPTENAENPPQNDNQPHPKSCPLLHIIIAIILILIAMITYFMIR